MRRRNRNVKQEERLGKKKKRKLSWVMMLLKEQSDYFDHKNIII